MDVVEAMRMWFMKDKVGEVLEGTVVGVSQYGLKIRLKDFYVEGFLHVSHLDDDYYLYEESEMSLTGRHTRPASFSFS